MAHMATGIWSEDWDLEIWKNWSLMIFAVRTWGFHGFWDVSGFITIYHRSPSKGWPSTNETELFRHTFWQQNGHAPIIFDSVLCLASSLDSAIVLICLAWHCSGRSFPRPWSSWCWDCRSFPWAPETGQHWSTSIGFCGAKTDESGDASFHSLRSGLPSKPRGSPSLAEQSTLMVDMGNADAADITS